MLVISRRVLETLIIGDGPEQIVVKVLGVHGNQVRVGVTAPKHISVDRAEVRARKDAEKAAST
jgi:carbon storage regulator